MEMKERIARRLTATLRHHGVEMHPDDIRGLAEDALAEMRLPDEGMIMAGANAPLMGEDYMLDEQVYSAWTAMIDHARTATPAREGE